jgi:D-3-phosphoglycerate dehydrogenase
MKVVCTSLNAENGPHIEMFRQADVELRIVPRDRSLFDADALVEMLGDCDAVIAGAEPYTRHVIESLPNLRVIARTGVGFDAIDLEACDERGIVVATTPGVNHHSVAEHTIALLMGLARGFPETDRQVREGRWQRIARPRVMGRTLGLVGLGRIGQATATRGVGLGLKVIAYEPFPNPEFVEQWKIELTSLDDLLRRSDYVSLHCPMSPENRHLINARTLAMMKPGAVLINTARGALVDERALYEALQSGHLRGAGLDVFEVEPLPLESPLLTLDNVLLAGHVAGLDEESHDDTFSMAARIILDLRNGGWPAHCIQNLKGCADWRWARK